MSDARFVLDASAVLATLLNERGGARVAEVIEQSALSTINLSEVVARLQDLRYSDVDADDVLADLGVKTFSFDDALAVAAGRLRAETRLRGLSFGDRACLALGRHLGVPVLTADRAWTDLRLGIDVEVIR